MEELMKFIRELEEKELEYISRTETLKRLKEIYKSLLREDIKLKLCEFVEKLDDREAIELHDNTEVYTWNYLAYENEEDFYENNCSGYIDAIERAMDSYNWSANDDYIDEDFYTFNEMGFGDKIRENSDIIAEDMINSYIKEEKYREYIENANYIDAYIKNILKNYMNNINQLN